MKRDQDSFARKVMTSAGWVSTAVIAKSAIGVLQILILSRFFSDDDFGRLAVIMSVISIFSVVSDLGLNFSIFHREKLEQLEVSSIYWLNVIVSFVLYLILAALSTSVSAIYGGLDISFFFIVAGLSLPLNAFSSLLKALSEKAMDFVRISIFEVLSVSIGFIFTLVLVYFGNGLISPILGMLCGGVVNSILCVTFFYRRMGIILSLNIDCIKPFIKFGGYAALERLINTFNLNMDMLLGGVFVGASNLGAYSIAKELTLKPTTLVNSIVTRVGLPMLSKMNNNDANISAAYLKMIRISATINFPMYLYVSFFAKDIVEVFLGKKWERVSDFLVILALWAVIRVIGNPIGSLIYAKGKAKLIFYWNLCMTVILPAFLLTGLLLNNALGLAASRLAFQLLVFILMWVFIVRVLLQISFWQYIASFMCPFICAGISVIFALLVSCLLENIVLRVVVSGISMCTVYLLLTFIFNFSAFHEVRRLLSVKL